MKKVVKKKKPIDMISEIDGKPVYPSVKKEKVLDLTVEINLFLENEISYESIKKIMLRIEGPTNDYEISKFKMKITRVSKTGYFILILLKSSDRKYYLDEYNFSRFTYFSRKEDVVTSQLKSRLRDAIWDWLVKQNLSFNMD
jgi:hypothetical protein